MHIKHCLNHCCLVSSSATRTLRDRRLKKKVLCRKKSEVLVCHFSEMLITLSKHYTIRIYKVSNVYLIKTIILLIELSLYESIQCYAFSRVMYFRVLSTAQFKENSLRLTS